MVDMATKVEGDFGRILEGQAVASGKAWDYLAIRRGKSGKRLMSYSQINKFCEKIFDTVAWIFFPIRMIIE